MRIRHYFNGGWATDFGPVSAAVPDNGTYSIPFLLAAENIVYELDGGPKKVGGVAKLNSTTLESGTTIRGIYDYWVNQDRRLLCHVGTKVKYDTGGGNFVDLFTGLQSTAIPSYNTFDNILIISSDSVNDVPKSWDLTTAQDLAGTPPNFSFSVTHKGRVFAAGVSTSPSTLYYSVEFDPEDWAGSGSGTIQIDPGDGDRITGLASFKDDLWVFKGPNKGSIHRITGSSNSGADAFAKVPFIRGLGAAAHNLIFHYQDDLGFFWRDGSIHTLKAVASFGDYNSVSLSRSIETYMRESVNLNLLKRGWAVNDVARDRLLFSLPANASTENNVILMLDYRFDPPRWAFWDAFAATALSVVIDPVGAGNQEIYSGSTDGFIYRMNREDKAVNASAIESKVLTPYIHYGDPTNKKTLGYVSVGSQPTGDYDITFKWRRDANPVQSATLSHGYIGDVLGAASSNQFTLGTSELGGSRNIEVMGQPEEGGEFRSIQYEISQTTLNQNLQIDSFSAEIEPGGDSTEN